MNSHETIVQVRLLAGELSGIRIAELPHGALQAILIPRNRLSEAKQRIEKRLAVYVLLGKSGKSGESAQPTAYIGQTDDACERLSCWNHDEKSDWWKTAVVAISNTADGLALVDGFTLTDIKWLESHCIQEASACQGSKGAERFYLKNDRQPDKPSISAAAQAHMLDVFDRLSTLLSVLGCPVFEPLEDIDRPPDDETGGGGTTPTMTFVCHGKDADAVGEFVDGKFLVRKGSLARPSVSPAATETVGRVRKKLVDRGVLVAEKGKLKFARDHKFNSPSGAAAVVLGRSADGWIEWENAAGKPLDEIMPRGGNAGVAIVPIKTIPPGPHPEPKGPRPHLKELIDAGILKAGQELRKPYKDKEPLRAKLLSDGRIQFNSETYSKPSGAAKAATGNSVDGWHFWQYQDKDGNWVLLDVASQAYREYLARKGK